MNVPSRLAAALLAAMLFAGAAGRAPAAMQAKNYTYHTRNNLYPDFAPDSRRLLWSSGRETYFHGLTLWSSTADTDTAVGVTHGDWGDEYGRYSPDGKTILFMSNRNGGWSIYSRRADLDTVTTITDSSRVNMYPAWTHDGRAFVYVNIRTDSTTGLVWQDFRTGQQRVLFEVKGSIFYPAVSPDDRYVYFSSANGGVKYDVYRVPLTGGKPEAWCDIPGNKMSPVFTPDGAHVLFAREEGDNIFNLFIAPLSDGRAVTRIETGRPNSYYPAFSPDGKWLVFCSTDETRSQDIWIAPWSPEELGGR